MLFSIIGYLQTWPLRSVKKSRRSLNVIPRKWINPSSDCGMLWGPDWYRLWLHQIFTAYVSDVHILECQHAKCDCRLWKILWFNCVFWDFSYIHGRHIITSLYFYKLCVEAEMKRWKVNLCVYRDFFKRKVIPFLWDLYIAYLYKLDLIF